MTKAITIRRPRRIVRVYRSARRSKVRVSLATVAGFAPLGISVFNDIKAGSPQNALYHTVQGLTGYSPWTKNWSAYHLTEGLLPIVGGVIVHKLANRFGINRMIAKSGIPFINI